MDKSTNTPLASHLQPPKESRSSIVLNSVGNGMMLGGIPFLGIEAWQLIRKESKPRPIIQGVSIAAAAVGGVLGWVFGEKEASRLQHYRQALTDEVTSLRGEVNQLKQEPHSWQERTQEAPSTPESKSL